MVTYNNVPNLHGLTRFRAVIDAYGGLAKVARFAVRINPSNTFLLNKHGIMRDLTFLCETAELPGKAFNVNEYRYGGPNLKYPSQTQYTDLSLSFIVRNRMLEKHFFDDWMMAINPTDTYNFNYKNSYATTIDIFALADFVDPLTGAPMANYGVTLDKAFPISMSPLQLVSGDDSFHRLQIQFAYNTWKKPDDPVPVATGIVSNKNIQ